MKTGNVTLENNVFLVPMAGVTDMPFRILCKEKGCGLVYTEMVSAMMKSPELASRVIQEVSRASTKPVTVKFRKGWDEESINSVEFAKMAEQSGAAAIAIHG